MKKIALISGITGQDGSYLTELLLEKGYIVHGIIRRSSSFNTFRIDHIYNNPEYINKSFFLHYGDLTDSSNLNRLVEKIQPAEIYNLGAQSHVQVSFEVPEYTAEVDGVGTLRFLDAIKETGLKHAFTRLQLLNFTVKCRRYPRLKRHRFIPGVPMLRQNYMHIGL
jgi:GDPmannose 4,6-dehydratase